MTLLVDLIDGARPAQKAAATEPQRHERRQKAISGRALSTPRRGSGSPNTTIAEPPKARVRPYSPLTVTCVSPENPRTRAAPGDTSIIRPRTKGPRSLMVTTTEFPLLLFVTFTFVPNGSVPMSG
jgi:hypothetical protein